MPKYQLEIKQRETYPRFRVNQEFFQSLIENRDIRTSGCPGLFSYTVLCSLAAFSKQNLRPEGISYAIDPGEWVCSVEELTEILRLRTRSQFSQPHLHHGQHAVFPWLKEGKVLNSITDL